MRSVSASLSSFLDSATLGIMRHLVTITTRDSTTARWTDHETNLTVGGTTWTAGGGATTNPLVLVATSWEFRAGLEIQETELTLLCGDSAEWAGTRLPLAAINGTFDGASVVIERVFGDGEDAGAGYTVDVTLGSMELFTGVVSSVTASSTSVVMRVASGLATLRGPLPRTVIQPGCTHMLYDSGCTLVIGTYTVSGTVAGSPTVTTIPSGRTEADGYFDLGVLTFTSGVNSGVQRRVRTYLNSGGTFRLDRPLSSAPSVGDTFDVNPGCDKLLATCDTKFSNTVHFRAFPFAPKTETA